MNGYVGTGAEAVYNSTWGHLAPQKNTSYKGMLRLFQSTHGEYSRGLMCLDYEFNNLESGPYIHDAVFDFISNKLECKYEDGVIFDLPVTFRNYRFYMGKPLIISKGISGGENTPQAQTNI